jgi:hypothetical protein
MGWILEALFDWWAVGAVDKASKRLPPWGYAALLVLPLAVVIGLLWLITG